MFNKFFVTFFLVISFFSNVFGASRTSNITQNQIVGNIDKKFNMLLADKVKRGILTANEAANMMNQVRRIKETYQHTLNEASVAKYKIPPMKTSHPIIPWEIVGISWTGDVFERIEKLYLPDGWMVKIIVINTSINHDQETIKYMHISDVEHKWKLSQNI